MSATAWLLTLADGSRVALGSHWIREVIGEHERGLSPMFSVPLMPDYCHQLMHWRNLFIPVLHLEPLVGITVLALGHYYVVVAYPPLEEKAHLHYGVIVCSALPMQITISDADPVAYSSPIWENYASSCFTYEGDAMPILDTAKVFHYHGSNNEPPRPS
ncbi:MAG: chemotaxis protein CheW [Mariprofundaceae bacterium]|nr:chemotaxis protein CheW [Mariprofundaceae bacterium]